MKKLLILLLFPVLAFAQSRVQVSDDGTNYYWSTVGYAAYTNLSNQLPGVIVGSGIGTQLTAAAISAAGGVTNSTRPANLFFFGDSITAGWGASSLQSNWPQLIINSYPQPFAYPPSIIASASLTFADCGWASPAQPANRSYLSLLNAVTADTAVFWAMGVNDPTVITNAGYLAWFTTNSLAQLAFSALPSAMRRNAATALQGDVMSRVSGTWSVNSTYGGNFALSGSGTGNTWTGKVSGATIAIGYLQTSQLALTNNLATVSVDGAAKPTIYHYAASQQSRVVANSASLQSAGCLLLTGLVDSVHTVIITSTNNVFIDWYAGWSASQSNQFPIVYVQIPFIRLDGLSTTNNWTNVVNAISNNVAVLAATGLRVYPIYNNLIITNSTYLPDLIHPNDAGSSLLASNWNAAVQQYYRR